MSAAAAPNRTLLTASIMLATVLQTLDTTIANVALPHMMGSLQAAQDQITWVLTSYIVAVAIMTPLTPWLADRLGRKLVFLVSVAGFTLTSALCGLSQNLLEIVAFRFLQGLFGAALIPLSQTVLLDINPPEKHGQAMASWAMAVIIGPIIGPALGGYLTDHFSWRWVFLINLPGGVLAFAGLWAFLDDGEPAQPRRFDFFGFLTLAAGIAALQLMLDRGAGEDWFKSTEIWIELAISLVALYLFIIHTLTARQPFFDRALARDRNFVTATILSFFVMSLMYSVLALLPPLLQNLMGYPVMTSGLVTMPRGIGSFIAMYFVGRLLGRVDSRLMVGTGVALTAASLYWMSGYSLEMDSWPVIWTGFVQGLAMGMIFVPLSTIGFGTLAPHLRTEATAVFNLVRNIGSAVGISVIQAMIVANNARTHAQMMEHVTPDNPIAQQLGPPFSLTDPHGIALLNAFATRQSAMLAYVDEFRFMALATLAMLPLLLLLRKPRGAKPDAHAVLD